MSVLKVTVDDTATDKARLFIESFKDQAMPAVCKSLNRAANGMRTDAAKEARTIYNVKASAVKKAAEFRKASFGKPEATVNFTGKYIPLIAFSPYPSRPKVYAKAGMTVKVKATRKRVRGAFVAQMKSGHIGVFKRKKGDYGRNKKPYLQRIKELRSVSIPQMISNHKVSSQLQSKAVLRFNKNLDHEMNYLIQKGGK